MINDKSVNLIHFQQLIEGINFNIDDQILLQNIQLSSREKTITYASHITHKETQKKRHLFYLLFFIKKKMSIDD
jgi:hypothetical protein